MYLHIFAFQTVELAQEASQINITCTNMTIDQTTDGKPTILFQTDYPLGPVTRMLLAQETGAIRVEANEPLAGAPPRYSVSLGQILLTVIAAVFLFGLVWLVSQGIAGAISAGTATGWIAFCSNDLLPILRGLTRTRKPEEVQKEEEPTAHV